MLFKQLKLYSAQFLVVSDQTQQHLFYCNWKHQIILYCLFIAIICPGHLSGLHPETSSARCCVPCKKCWVSLDLVSETESPQWPEELGQNSNFVSLSTSQLLSQFTQGLIATALVKSGFPRAVLRIEAGTQKSTLLRREGTTCCEDAKMPFYPPVINTHTFLTEFVADIINPETVCANPHGRCLEGHTKNHFLLWEAAITLSVLSTAKCLI